MSHQCHTGERKPATGPIWNGERLTSSLGEPPANQHHLYKYVPPPSAIAKQHGTYKKPPFKLAGICGSLLGTVFFCSANLCVKMGVDNSIHGKLKMLFFRGVFMALCSSIVILYQRGTFRVPRNELSINIMRALCGTSCILSTYCSLSYISLGDSTALVFSSPIWTCILSRIILKEQISWFQVLAIPVSLLGIILIAHPALLIAGLEAAGSGHELAATATSTTSLLATAGLPVVVSSSEQVDPVRWPGIVFALAASVFMSCTLIVLKFRRETPVQTTTFWFGFAMILTASVALPFLGPLKLVHRPRDYLLLTCNGLLSWLSQTIILWTLTYESPNVVALCRTLDVAFGFLLSAVVLDDVIHWTSILGSAITASVVTLLVLNKWLEDIFCYPKQAKPEYVVEASKSSPKESILNDNNNNNNCPQQACYTVSEDKLAGDMA